MISIQVRNAIVGSRVGPFGHMDDALLGYCYAFFGAVCSHEASLARSQRYSLLDSSYRIVLLYLYDVEMAQTRIESLSLY